MTLLRAFTTGRTQPGPRYRIFQFEEMFRAAGYRLVTRQSPFGGYPPRAHSLRPLWGAASLLWRTAQMIDSHGGGINIFQRELISTRATVEWMSGRPRILDVDDAVWLSARNARTDAIARQSDLVICGNSFLAEHYRKVLTNVMIIPTAVDVSLYPPRLRDSREHFVIGWSGTSGGFKYLLLIQEALSDVLTALPNARIRVMADRPPTLPLVPPERLEFVRWSPEVEATTIASFDVGIMPLADTDWERGKCSYKMLQYMAAQIPVVVSPVGMNIEVLAAGSVGIGASNTREWVDALVGIFEDTAFANGMGHAGRQVVERLYSKERVGRSIISALDTMRPAQSFI